MLFQRQYLITKQPPSRFNIVPPGELHDGCNTHGLKIRQRPGRDGSGKGIGNIIGTNVPCIEEGKDRANGKQVVILMEIHLEIAAVIRETEEEQPRLLEKETDVEGEPMLHFIPVLEHEFSDDSSMPCLTVCLV